MTTLSGPPKAAWVAAWQCSTLHTVMSPSIRSVVSELCQEGWGEVGGRWGRLRDSNSDRKRQSKKGDRFGWREKTKRVRHHKRTAEKLWKDQKNLYVKTNVLKENKTQRGVNISTRAHSILIPSHCQEEVIKRVHSTGRLPYCCCQRLWIANERGERRFLLIWRVWGICTNVHYLLPSYFWVKYPLNLLHTGHRKNKVLILKRLKPQTAETQNYIWSSAATSCPLWGGKEIIQKCQQRNKTQADWT